MHASVCYEHLALLAGAHWQLLTQACRHACRRASLLVGTQAHAHTRKYRHLGRHAHARAHKHGCRHTHAHADATDMSAGAQAATG